MVDRKYPRHDFWGAGEPDCPRDLKAPNGELHTMRCKVCGDGWRESSDVCMAQIATLGSGRGAAILSPEARKKIEEALEMAKNGLAWYRAEYPDADSPADDEAQDEIDSALALLADIPEAPVAGMKPIGYARKQDLLVYRDVVAMYAARPVAENGSEPVALYSQDQVDAAIAAQQGREGGGT